jgi:hypothetical protein
MKKVEAAGRSLVRKGLQWQVPRVGELGDSAPGDGQASPPHAL